MPTCARVQPRPQTLLTDRDLTALTWMGEMGVAPLLVVISPLGSGAASVAAAWADGRAPTARSPPSLLRSSAAPCDYAVLQELLSFGEQPRCQE